MTTQEAFAVLEDALRRCGEDDMRTPAVDAALTALESHATERWPFDQFRQGLAGTGDTIADGVGRRQVVNASLNGIRRVCGGGR